MTFPAWPNRHFDRLMKVAQLSTLLWIAFEDDLNDATNSSASSVGEYIDGVNTRLESIADQLDRVGNAMPTR